MSFHSLGSNTNRSKVTKQESVRKMEMRCKQPFARFFGSLHLHLSLQLIILPYPPLQFFRAMHKPNSPSDRRPLLAESPQQIRARRGGTSVQTPPSSAGKTQMPTRRSWVAEELRVRSEMKPMLGEFQALAKMVEDELGCAGLSKPISVTRSSISSTLFERGRLYDEYSARRNERLKRKKAETEDDRCAMDPGAFNVEFGKRKTAKKTETLRKSVPANFSVPRREGLRSSVRLSKENKQPLPTNTERPAVEGDRKRLATRASRRKAEY